MADPALIQMIMDGVAHHQAGRLSEAESLYRQVLAADPQNLDGLHLLGLISHQKGNHQQAAELVGKAVRVNATQPGIWFNYGNILAAGGADGKAADAFRTAIGLQPGYADAYNNLANALERLHRHEEMAAALQSLATLRPQSADVQHRLGWSLQRLGHFGRAVEAYQKAVTLDSGRNDSRHNLAAALQSLGRTDEAIAIYRQVLAVDPKHADAMNNLAAGLRSKGAIQEAAATLRKAVQTDPNNAAAHSNLGLIEKDAGQITDATNSAAHAMRLQPADPKFHSNFLLTLLYSDITTPEEIFTEHLLWAKRHAEPLTPPAPRRAHSGRRLRIGYVSNDFFKHPVGHFILPILERHDRQAFEVTCYSGGLQNDAITAELQKSADHWAETTNLSDEALAERIRADEIDLLVDLAGHTSQHRLLTFARRPAPVQVSYLGYPATTGLSAMDYRITDAFADPPEMTERYYTEKLVRLPRCFLCFKPPADSPPVNALPASVARNIAFGSFNHAGKITPTTLKLWAGAMNAVPGSLLVLKAIGLMDPATRNRLLGDLEKLGIAKNRVDILPVEPDYRAHLQRYHRIDIALDTYPYHGTTTTCEALWMGVPVITLAGQTHVSRVGVSLLSNAGLSDGVAASAEEFSAIAARWAQDRDQLARTRKSLRDQLSASPLMDAGGFTRDLEASYLQMTAATT